MYADATATTAVAIATATTDIAARVIATAFHATATDTTTY